MSSDNTMGSLNGDTKKEIMKWIETFVSTADLETCTHRQIRESLEARFELNLSDSKTWLSSVIDDIILKRVEEDAVSTRKEESEGTSDESDFPASDHEVALAMQRKEVELSRPLRTRRGDLGKKRATKRARTEESKKTHMKRPATNSVFNRPWVLSSALSNLLDGERELSRPQVVKRIWAYVKEHQLQDPANKQVIVCDEKLRAVMKKDRIGIFAMNKVLSSHLSTKEETREVDE